MKKLLVVFSLIVLVCSCDKNQIDLPVQEEDKVEVEGGLQTGELPEVIYASMSDEEQSPETRTYVDGNRKDVLWQTGDAISYFAGEIHNVQYVYNGETPASKVELEKVDETGTEKNEQIGLPRGIYPYSSDATVVVEDGVDKIYVTYPANQTYAPNSFGRGANLMIATGSDDNDANLYFRNACGYLVIKLYGDGTKVKNITISSLDGVDKISGDAFIVTDEDNLPVITMSDEAVTAVTLDCTNGGDGVALGAARENATEFWFALPPVNLEGGIKIVVTDMNDQLYRMQTTKAVNITRNNIQPMAALEFVSNLPAANKIWYTKTAEAMAEEGGMKPTEFYDHEDAPNPFDATIKAHYFDETAGKFVIEFTSPVTTIQEYAFRDTQIETISLPEGLVTIEREAFRNTPLTEITIPGSVNTIGVDVFYGCEHLTSVTFNSSPTTTPLSIGYVTLGAYEYGAFYDTKLTSVNLYRELIYTKGKNSNGEDIIFTPDEWDEGLFSHTHYNEVGTVTVTLGPQVETLSKFMFAYLPIQTLTIPGSVTAIHDDVFRGCTELATLTFEPSPSGTALTMGYDTDGEVENLFQDYSPLETLNLNREINYTFDEEDIDSDSEGLFGGMSTLKSVTLGEQVKKLSNHMFAGSLITELVIPGSVNTIENDVFHGCTALTSLTFKPSSTKETLTIGYDTYGEEENLFQNYCPLKTLDLDREINYTLTGVDTKSEGLFGDMSTLTSVTLGDQVSTLTPFMFAGTGITSLDLNNVATIGNSALAYTAITSLTIPACVNTIGSSAFDECSALSSITFEENETALEIKGQGNSDGPFYDSPLTTIDYNRNFVYKKVNGEEFIPSDDSDGIFAISNDAKNKITGKSVVTIGELIQTIPDYMCNNLAITELTIPNTVANLGMHAFLNCDRLSNITIQDDTNSLNLQTQTYSASGPFYNSPLTDIYLGREILYNEGAYKPGMSESGIFYSEKSAKVDEVNLSISNNVKTISPYMFAHLKLKSITIPASIISIGLNAFVECQSLNSIVFEDSITPLTVSCHHTLSAKGPFYQSPLTSITLGRNIDYVDFYGKPFTPSETDDGFFASEDTVESLSITLTNNVQTISEYMFAGRPITQINIPASVTEIKDHAFQSCTALASLTIPGTVNTIGNDVFNECTSLAKITFEPSETSPATPLTLGYNTEGEEDGPFLDSRLTSVDLNREINYTLASIDLDHDDEGIFSGRPLTDGVTIGEQVKTFSKYMFSCSGIKSLTIPANVVKIADHVFTGCEALASVRFEGSTTPLTIGFQPGTNEHGPFYQSPLTSIYVNREIVASEAYAIARDADDEGIFSTPSNSRNVSVTLQGNVNTISDYMFSGVQMETIWIPREVTSIGKEAFEDCSKLYGVTLAHSNPPILGVDAFDGTQLQNEDATRWIALQDATNINAFKTAHNWAEYAGIIIAQIKQ